ncbi:MAG: hypothetical protein AB8I08_27825 [Sandaracinaceae bacterium]
MSAVAALRSPVWPWLLVSGVVHALIAMIAIGVYGAGLLVEGRGQEDGDGFGGTSVEFEIRGPADRLPTGSMASRTAAPPPVAVPELVPDPEPSAPQVAEAPPAPRPPPPDPEGEVPVAPPPSQPRQAQAPLPLAPGQSETPAEGAEEGSEESAPGEGELAGTGGEATTAGTPAGDPASIILGSAGVGGDEATARRLLLPNGGACTDPAVGRWRAQKYRASDRTWVRFILRVRREGGALAGTIESRIWTGRASDPRPGECTAFGSDHTWQMQATGSIEGTTMRFVSRRARLVAEHCPRGGTQYAPDRFQGTVHPLREVFQAVNNDGAFDIDEPYTFRRVSCEP